MNHGDALIGLASILAGIRTFRHAFRPRAGTAGLGGGVDLSKSTRDVQRQIDRLPSGRRKAQGTRAEVQTLDERMGHILRVTRRGAQDPDLRMTTARLLSRKCGTEWCAPSRDSSAEITAIFEAVTRHVRYTRDPHGVDLFQSPMRTLQTGAADCDDMSILLGSMMLTVGYPVRFRVIRGRRSPDWDHIYALVGVPPGEPTRWIPLDASVTGAPVGWEPPRSEIAACRDFAVS